ncbi:hypothetical protein MGYG_06518 [Nannizzia gypsea CBS 118893]|uniref:Uncharacterized protein n=1 Tax=Arthroderma gypseum (strain ATCC MYA-4604 / CBS 118893) TaxID=535722 RepID=E4UZJ1_ARTGP|nr:hypothetical protein MGYG_06518 [Nannizzia gypsea CBS 118893]EFR03521.1 hypothetical protein MGYG_06518 [Nannizzia gypsea CBS 118893]
MPPPSNQRADIEPPPQVTKEATIGFITGAGRVIHTIPIPISIPYQIPHEPSTSSSTRIAGTSKTSYSLIRRPLDPSPSDPLPSASNALFIEHAVLAERSERQTTTAAPRANAADIQAPRVVFELDRTHVEGLSWVDAAV